MRRDPHPVAVFVILLVVVFAAETLVMLAFAALRTMGWCSWS